MDRRMHMTLLPIWHPSSSSSASLLTLSARCLIFLSSAVASVRHSWACERCIIVRKASCEAAGEFACIILSVCNALDAATHCGPCWRKTWLRASCKHSSSVVRVLKKSTGTPCNPPQTQIPCSWAARILERKKRKNENEVNTRIDWKSGWLIQKSALCTGIALLPQWGPKSHKCLQRLHELTISTKNRVSKPVYSEAKSIPSVRKMVSQPICNRDTPNYLTMTKYTTHFPYCFRAKQRQHGTANTAGETRYFGAPCFEWNFGRDAWEKMWLSCQSEISRFHLIVRSVDILTSKWPKSKAASWHERLFSLSFLGQTKQLSDMQPPLQPHFMVQYNMGFTTMWMQLNRVLQK